MKHFLFFLFTLILCSCNNSNSFPKDHFIQSEVTYPKEKIVSNDRFNLEEFENLRHKAFLELKKSGHVIGNENDFDSGDQILFDGTKIKMISNLNRKEKYYQVNIEPPPPSLFKVIKIYYPNGVIFRIMSHIYIGEIDSPSGITRIYNENGVLEEIINNDKRYDGIVNVDNLIKILIDNKLLNPYNDIDRKSYIIEFDRSRMIWRTEHHTNYFSGDIIEVDALTGKIISKKHVVRDDIQDHG